jgi:hypothetical protein
LFGVGDAAQLIHSKAADSTSELVQKSNTFHNSIRTSKRRLLPRLDLPGSRASYTIREVQLKSLIFAKDINVP